MKEKIINSLAIIFLAIACIFNSLSIFKIKEQIQQNNNKIVETKGVKRAFENAPTKTNELPSFNEEFKIFFNISTIEELTIFYETYSVPSNSDNMIYYFIGSLEEKLNIGENLYATGFYISSYGSKIQFFMIVESSEINMLFPYFIYSIGKQNNNLAYWDDVEIPNGTEMTTDSGVDYFISSVNELFSGGVYKSLEKITIGENVIEINGTFSSNFVYGYDLKGNSIPSALLGTITIIATGILNILISLFNNVLPIFWVNNAPTFIGTIVLFAVAIPIVYWVINFILGLIRKIRLTRGK